MQFFFHPVTRPGFDHLQDYLSDWSIHFHPRAWRRCQDHLFRWQMRRRLICQKMQFALVQELAVPRQYSYSWLAARQGQRLMIATRGRLQYRSLVESIWMVSCLGLALPLPGSKDKWFPAC